MSQLYNLRYENLNKIEASLICFCQMCTVCNQGLGQFHIHVNFVIGNAGIGRDILSTDVVMQTNPNIINHD